MYCRTVVASWVLAMAAWSAPPCRADAIVGPGQSIQMAIDSAIAGDTIHVAPGLYHEAIDFRGKAIHVVALAGPGSTVIDAAGLLSPVVRFLSGEPAGTTLEGFTLRRGRGTHVSGLNILGGAGILITNGSRPLIRHCRVTENAMPLDAENFGGGLLAVASAPILEDCLFEDNSAYYGGGVAAYGELDPIEMRRCLLRGNRAVQGGGLYGALVKGNDCRLVDNRASLFGGGYFISGFSHSQNTLSRWQFIANRAGLAGGGLIDNSIQSLNGIELCAFIGNRAPQGAGLRIQAGQPGGDPSSVTIENCLFAQNSGNSGAAMQVATGFFSSGTIVMRHCTVADHATGGGIAVTSFGTALAIESSVLRGNFPVHVAGAQALTFDHCNVEGGAPGVGNIDADPLFIDAAGGDYHLLLGSPCIDAATAALGGFDFEGDARPTDAGAADIGADEFAPHLYFLGDPTPGKPVFGRLLGLPTGAPVVFQFSDELLSAPIPTGQGPYYLGGMVQSIVLPPIKPNGALPFGFPLEASHRLETYFAQANTGDHFSNLAVVNIW